MAYIADAALVIAFIVVLIFICETIREEKENE